MRNLSPLRFSSVVVAALLVVVANVASAQGDQSAPNTSLQPVHVAQAPGVMGTVLDTVDGARSIRNAPAEQGQTVPTRVSSTAEPANKKGRTSGTLPSAEAGLTDWPDPTTLDHYKDYPQEPPRPDGLDQPLKAIAESMEPGEWRRLPDAKYLGEGKWSDKAVWDARRERVSYVGMHGIPERPVKWVAWDVDDGTWHRQTGDEFHPYAGIHSKWGYRSYGRYTQLANGANVFARFGRLWKQDPETLEWAVWDRHGCYSEIGNLEYFPEMGAVVSLGAMYAGRDKTKFCAYDVEAQRWRSLPTPAVQGRHSLMRYNPVRGEILLLGGDDSYRSAQILRADGTLKTVADAPVKVRIRSDYLVADPRTGHYLLMATEHVDGVDFFGFDAERNRWYQISDWKRVPRHKGGRAWPFTSEHAEPVVTAIPELDVTLWIESTRSGVHLYKHKAPETE